MKGQKREGRLFLQGARWSQELEMAKTALRPGDGEKISQWGIRIRRSETGGHRETETRELYPSGPRPPLDRTERKLWGRGSQVAPRAASPASPAPFLDVEILRPHSDPLNQNAGCGALKAIMMHNKTWGPVGGKKAPAPTPFFPRLLAAPGQAG